VDRPRKGMVHGLGWLLTLVKIQIKMVIIVFLKVDLRVAQDKAWVTGWVDHWPGSTQGKKWLLS